MTTKTKRLQSIREEVADAITEIMIEDLADGANDYAYVRVWPDGSVTSGREPSPCTGECEYFGKIPHEITVWSTSGMRECADPGDGVFQWVPDVLGPYITSDEDDYKVVQSLDNDQLGVLVKQGWFRFDLDRTINGLIDDLDIGMIMEEVDRRLDEWADDNLQGE